MYGPKARPVSSHPAEWIHAASSEVELIDTAIVIPARNEARRLPAVLAAIPVVRGLERAAIFVVDDGSSDATGDLARAAGATVLTNPISLGMGGALVRGCEAAVSGGANTIVMMDADGQHDPADVPALLKALDNGDVAHGVRSMSGEMPLLYRVGNLALTIAQRVLFGIRSSDTQAGLWAFRAETFPVLRWRSSGYSIASEILVRTHRAGLRLVEVPMRTIYLDRHKGTRPLDGVKILALMVKWRFRPPA